MLLKQTLPLTVGLLALLSIHIPIGLAGAQFSQTKSQSATAGNESSPATQESDAITAANWQQHPKVSAVRDLVVSTNAQIRKGSLKTSTRRFEYCEPFEDTLRKMAVDSKGVVRRYEKEGGSEDSSLTWQHYYDQLGRLRFVFIVGKAVNGAHLEHRIYLDESGQRLWESHKYLKRPEYSFPAVWPDEQLQKSDPAKAFAAAARCAEVR